MKTLADVYKACEIAGVLEISAVFNFIRRTRETPVLKMHISIILLFSLVTSNIECRRKPGKSGSCSCEITANSSLLVHCIPYNREVINACFSKYNHARSLVFTHSNLKRIPKEISILTELKSVDLSTNNLTDLDFSDLRHTCSLLEELNVESNNITVLRKGRLDCFSNLRDLNIANNGLKEIEFGTFSKRLKHFHYLYAQYNDLASIDSSLISMLNETSEVFVNVSFNKISQVTNSANLTISEISRKERFLVQLMHNNFTKINVTYYTQLFHVTNILQLYNLWNCGIDVRFNPLICDCYMYHVALMMRLFRHMDPNNPVFSITCYTPQALRGMRLYSVPDTDFNCTVDDKCPIGCSCTETISVPLMTVVCGASYSEKSLPREIPGLKTTHIYIKNTNLQILESRPYLKNVSVLDVSQNKLDIIDARVISELGNIQRVYLNDNLLKYMPEKLDNVNLKHTSILTLDGNPFKCDCHSLWFKRWLLKHQNLVPNQNKVLCTTGTPVTHAKDSDFICAEPFAVKFCLAIAFSVLFVLILILLVVRGNWTHIQVLLIANFNIYCFRRKVRTNLKYDIFLSHSSKDDEIVYQEIIPKLENNDPPFTLCRDDRDFIVGRTIAYNIISKIESSLTTLLVISNNFLRSEWCKMEFKRAHLKLLTEKRSNLIMIILEDLDPDLMDKELAYYIKTHVYLKMSDKYFWPKLFQALPIREEISSSSSVTSSKPSSVSLTSSTDKTEHMNRNEHQSITQSQWERTPLLAPRF